MVGDSLGRRGDALDGVMAQVTEVSMTAREMGHGEYGRRPWGNWYTSWGHEARGRGLGGEFVGGAGVTKASEGRARAVADSGWKRQLRAYLKSVPAYGSTTDVITDVLREAILDGVLAPSTWLREDELASELSVSRTPVRVALRRLSDERLAVRLTNRGTVVTSMTSTTCWRCSLSGATRGPGCSFGCRPPATRAVERPGQGARAGVRGRGRQGCSGLGGTQPRVP